MEFTLEKLAKALEKGMVVEVPRLGAITINQIPTLNLEQMDAAHQTYHNSLSNKAEGSLSGAASTLDQAIKDKMEVIAYFYGRKKSAQEAIKEAKAIKEQKAKIQAILEQKKEDSLSNLSIEELEKMLNA